MKIFNLILFSFFCFVCFSQKNPIEIDFNPELMEVSDLGLSDFIESVEYIPLETKDECLIGQGMIFDFDENHIIVKYNTAEFVYLFDRKGHFVRTIGSRGGGPNEFLGISNIFLDNERIVVESMGKVLYFNKQGECLYSIRLPVDDRYAAVYFQEKFLRMAESYVYRDSSYNVFTIYNQKGYLIKEAVSSIPIPVEKDSNWRISYKCKQIMPVYMYQNMPHVREYLNDTVYFVNGLNQFKSKYVFNLGKYKITPKIQADIEHFEGRIHDKICILNIIEMSNGLLMQYFYEKNIYSCYYDKKKCKLYKFKSSGYLNDYDGGMDFRITGSLMGQKNRLVRTVFYADDIISYLERETQEKPKMKGPSSAIVAFKKMSEKIKMEDNPIVVIVKLKE